MQALVTGQPCVLVVDHVKLERNAFKLVSTLSGALKCFPDQPLDSGLFLSDQYINPEVFVASLDQSSILIKVAEFIQIYSLKTLFQLIHSLKTSQTKVKQVWLWATPTSIGIDMVVPYLEHLASVVVMLNDAKNMNVLSKKVGGAVSKKMFSYTITDGCFELSEIKKEVGVKELEPAVNPESLTTFKINFDEEELEARNTLKLPYERTSDEQPTESKIIYHPDADDDFDEEDPDDDLNI